MDLVMVEGFEEAEQLPDSSDPLLIEDTKVRLIDLVETDPDKKVRNDCLDAVGNMARGNSTISGSGKTGTTSGRLSDSSFTPCVPFSSIITRRTPGRPSCSRSAPACGPPRPPANRQRSQPVGRLESLAGDVAEVVVEQVEPLLGVAGLRPPIDHGWRDPPLFDVVHLAVATEQAPGSGAEIRRCTPGPRPPAAHTFAELRRIELVRCAAS